MLHLGSIAHRALPACQAGSAAWLFNLGKLFLIASLASISCTVFITVSNMLSTHF
jgi:hypothetical protein